MKKILCLIDTLDMGGGAERQMAGLAGLLHKKGKDVVVATYHRHSSDSFLEEKYGIRSVLMEAKSSSVSKILAVKRFIKNNKFDIVIAYKDGPTMLCCILKMIGMKYKLVVSERNTTQTLNRRERMKFFLYRWADRIVPNSITQGEFIKKTFPNLASKVYVITNFTDTSHFCPLNENSQRFNDKLKILITARIARQKNVLGFMEAVKKIKDKGYNIKFDWFGSVYSGQEDYGAEVRIKYNELKLEDILAFHQATSNIQTVYQACDVFCLPSYYEGYPNVICEAMSCGKPILCSKVCDNPTIVEEGINGFMFDPHNSDDIVEKIEMMYHQSGENLTQMGRSSRSLAEKKFSEESFVDKYIELIETC